MNLDQIATMTRVSEMQTRALLTAADRLIPSERCLDITDTPLGQRAAAAYGALDGVQVRRVLVSPLNQSIRIISEPGDQMRAGWGHLPQPQPDTL